MGPDPRVDIKLEGRDHVAEYCIGLCNPLEERLAGGGFESFGR
jgi:hypothetical protein